MRRELTEEEKQFIQSELITTDFASDRRARPKVKKKRNYFWKNIKFWITFIMLIPVVLSMMFAFVLFNVGNLFGGQENIKFLSTQDLSQYKLQQVGTSDFSWMGTYITLYNNRFLIIAGMFSVAIIICLVILVTNMIINRDKDELDNDNEETDADTKDSE